MSCGRTVEYVYEGGEIVGMAGIPYATEKAVEALFETVRTLAALQQETAHTAWLHARNAGHEQLARRLAGIEERVAAVIADELTWPEDKEVVDAFGEAG